MTRLFPFLLAVPSLLCATDGLLLSAGYSAPGPLEVAPGQVLTLFFRGIAPAANGSLRAGQASAIPWPETLAGLSATVLQGQQTFRVPVLSVRQQNECEEPSQRPICLLTTMRVQIPSEITPAVAKLQVSADGQAGRAFLLRPIRDSSHILTDCDLTWDTNPGSVCSRLAFHADGSVVGERSPARPGEALVIYAYGLGPTQPRVPSGAAAPAGVSLLPQTAQQIKVTFQVFRNANPAFPRTPELDDASRENTLFHVGVTQGQVGLYQLNVKVPAPLDIPLRCGGDTFANVLVKIYTSMGVENLPLCVE